MNPREVTDKKFTIVVTDSGLGGLSVTAELEKSIGESNNSGGIDIIFFNSLAASDFGYNSMPNMEKKAEVFDAALAAMVELYQPDMILIACNTLSVVYEHTSFSKNTAIDVIGIIDLGVGMILEELQSNKNQRVLLLGTPTTISSNTYQKKLIEKGVDERNIIGQSCPSLESEIQLDPDSEKVRDMVSGFIAEAGIKRADAKRIIAALCCTHYGYSERIFSEVIYRILQADFTIVNPNHRMVGSAIDKLPKNDRKRSETSVKVVTQVRPREIEIQSIGKILDLISHKTAKALRGYEYRKDLFRFFR